VEKTGLGRLGQLVRERMRLLGGDVEAEDLHGNETVTRGLVCAENRTKRANTDLMQHPEGAERRRWGEGRRIFSGQGACSSRDQMNLTQIAGSALRATRIVE
jgi:hypothetical protein